MLTIYTQGTLIPINDFNLCRQPQKKKKKSKRYLNQALVNYGGEFSLIDEDNNLK